MTKGVKQMCMLREYDLRILRKNPRVPKAIKKKGCSKVPDPQYINSKIYEANTLIDKVKDTLDDIKNNAKILKDVIDEPVKPTENKETSTEEGFVSQVVYDTADTPSKNDNSYGEAQFSRPITRRQDRYVAHVGLDKGNKFRNSIDDKMDEASKVKELTSLECLQLKLNTINEQAESDLSSCNSVHNVSRRSIIEEKETATTCCNTDSVILQSQETQVQLEVKSSSTQFFKDSLDGATQTDKERKTLSPENKITYEIIQPPPTAKQLIVQVLPPVDITGDFVLQKIYQISIGSNDMTHVDYKSSQENVGYFEMYGDDALDPQLSILNIRKKLEIFKKLERQDLDYSETNYADLSYGLDTHNETASNETVYDGGSRSLAHKEMVYKSFQLLDNPNKHDPGSVPHDMGITAMDTSVYKTFIDPKGFPETLSDIDHQDAANDMGKFRGKISRISGHPLRPKTQRPSEMDTKKPLSMTPPSIIRRISELSSVKESSQKKVNSKLWDIGLYCSKSVQCNPKVDTTNNDRPSDTQESKDSSNRFDNPHNSISSYDKISLTISYSTETSDSSNNSVNKYGEVTEGTEKEYSAIDLDSVTQVYPKSPDDDITLSSTSKNVPYNKKVENNKVPQDNALGKVIPHKTEEREKVVQNMSPNHSNSVTNKVIHNKRDEREKIVREIKIDHANLSSASTSKKIPPKSLYQDEIHDLLASKRTLKSSTDSEVSQFIKTLTNAESGELKKVMPKVQRSPSKDKNHEYTALPVQIHGDCWPTENHKRNPHLKLSDNGRYKDEANLFCKSCYSKCEDVSMRRRALNSLPRYYYKKYTLDKVNSDIVTMDETMSEGEIKCCCNGSIGEIHRCKSMFPDNKKQPHLESRSFLDDVGRSVREKRTYFNHWITYYIDKNKGRSVNDSSSTSNNTM